MLQTCNVVVPTATLATIALLGLSYIYYKRKTNSIPKQWKPVGKVIQLLTYPLKSGRRRELQSGKCTKLGIVTEEKNVELRDRSLIVYGASNFEFKTARTFPKMVLIETSGSDGGFIFTAPGQDPVKVKFPNLNDKRIIISVHKREPIEGVDCGDEVAAWLSQYITDKPSGLRLAYHIGDFNRDIEKYYPNYSAYRGMGNYSGGLYQDLTSYLLLNQASVDFLNSRLEEKITALNFRPNILVEGLDLLPYSEENWNWIKIGEAIFRATKPCTRCVFTTIDPESGVMSKTREPLKTLTKANTLKEPAHIKSEGKSPVMGIHLGIIQEGQIKVGDEVYIG